MGPVNATRTVEILQRVSPIRLLFYPLTVQAGTAFHETVFDHVCTGLQKHRPLPLCPVFGADGAMDDHSRPPSPLAHYKYFF